MAKLNLEIRISKILVDNIRNTTSALQKIVDLHGTKSKSRHECAEMANIARTALYNLKESEDG